MSALPLRFDSAVRKPRSRLKRRLEGKVRCGGGLGLGFNIISTEGYDDYQFSDEEGKHETAEAILVNSVGAKTEMARLPCDRAAGNGWSMLSMDTHAPDWPVLGCDSESIFLFLHNKNQAESEEQPSHHALQRANSGGSCGSEMSRSRASSAMSLLAEELAVAAAVC